MFGRKPVTAFEALQRERRKRKEESYDQFRERVRLVEDKLLVDILGWEGRYHTYRPYEQPDGSTIHAHATVTRFGATGPIMETSCPGCMLLLEALRRIETGREIAKIEADVEALASDAE